LVINFSRVLRDTTVLCWLYHRTGVSNHRISSSLDALGAGTPFAEVGGGIPLVEVGAEVDLVALECPAFFSLDDPRVVVVGGCVIAAR